MESMTREEARQKWLAQLRLPESGKFRDSLENADCPSERCCLGHAAHAVGAPREVSDGIVDYDGFNQVLSGPLQHLFGISHDGTFSEAYTGRELAEIIGRPVPYRDFDVWGCLAGINDDTDLTPAEMASVIEHAFANDRFSSPDPLADPFE